MRSLTAKLVAAFLFTSVVGMALAFFFIWRSVATEFDDYVVTQLRSIYSRNAASYYAENQSWDGVAQARLDSYHIFDQQGQQADSKPRDPNRNPPPLPLRFAVADTTGHLLIPLNGFKIGDAVPRPMIQDAKPIVVDGQTVGYVVVQIFEPVRDTNENRYLTRTSYAIGWAALGAAMIALLSGFILARFITRPVKDMTVAARAIAEGDLAQHVPVRSSDELGLLAAQFNRMSADLARSNQLRRQMTADIAHDLRTPLTVISGYLEALRDEVLKPSPKRFATMYDETQLLLRLVEELHMLSQADAGELPLAKQPLTARQLLERTAALYQHEADQQGVRLAVQLRGEPAMVGDPEYLSRALGNLVSNALHHTQPGDSIALSAEASDSRVELVVEDTGCGIAAEHLPNIFERFYRADESRQIDTGGSGLGLAIVKSIVEAHGGQVSVSSELGGGTRFVLSIPFERPLPHQLEAPQPIAHPL